MMIDRGMPALFATSLLRVVKLAVLLFFPYVAFWFAVFITLVAVVTWIAAHADLTVVEDKAEWRDGIFGLLAD